MADPAVEFGQGEEDLWDGDCEVWEGENLPGVFSVGVAAGEHRQMQADSCEVY